MQIRKAEAHAIPKGKTDWNRLRSMTDEDIQRGIDSDPDSAPALSYDETKATYKPAGPRIER